jgi:hypothetical protein
VAALLAAVIGAGLTACGEDADVVPAAAAPQEVKPGEHEAHRDLARASLASVKPGEHLGHRDAAGSATSVKPGEHRGRAR